MTLKNAISRQIFELWGRPTPRMKWEIELLLFNSFLDTTNQFENLTDQPTQDRCLMLIKKIRAIRVVSRSRSKMDILEKRQK